MSGCRDAGVKDTGSESFAASRKRANDRDWLSGRRPDAEWLRRVMGRRRAECPSRPGVWRAGDRSDHGGRGTLAGVIDDPGLFDLPRTPEAAQFQLPAIRDDQIAEIRAAFEMAGILDQDARRVIVSRAAARDVASLRDLKAQEARAVIAVIAAQRAEAASPAEGRGSAWDNRESDTWIDRL